MRRIYDEHAPRYDAVAEVAERFLFEDSRKWAAGQAFGDTLEVAIGTARNLPYYGDGTHLTGIDISGPMLAHAAERARRSARPLKLVRGDAQRLPFANERFDSVVMTLSLCTIPDDRQALAEAWRVLRVGGRLDIS